MKQFMLFVLLIILCAPLLLSATACAPSHRDDATEHTAHLAEMSELPPTMQTASKAVSDAYRFAVANPEATKNVPCFCGCGPLGHTSNYDCYVQTVSNGDKIIFDEHALGCVICIDITQDVMRMTGAGRAPSQIRQTIINTYTHYGPSNQP